jgi:hypothetical protein
MPLSRDGNDSRQRRATFVKGLQQVCFHKPLVLFAGGREKLFIATLQLCGVPPQFAAGMVASINHGLGPVRELQHLLFKARELDGQRLALGKKLKPWRCWCSHGHSPGPT